MLAFTIDRVSVFYGVMCNITTWAGNNENIKVRVVPNMRWMLFSCLSEAMTVLNIRDENPGKELLIQDSPSSTDPLLFRRFANSLSCGNQASPSAKCLEAYSDLLRFPNSLSWCYRTVTFRREKHYSLHSPNLLTARSVPFPKNCTSLFPSV